MGIRLERLKAAKLKGYIADKDIYDAIRQHMEATKNPVKLEYIKTVIDKFFNKGLNSQLKLQRKMHLYAIGEFKQTNKGKIICQTREHNKFKKKIRHNRKRSQSQVEKRKLLKNKDFPIS